MFYILLEFCKIYTTTIKISLQIFKAGFTPALLKLGLHPTACGNIKLDNVWYLALINISWAWIKISKWSETSNSTEYRIIRYFFMSSDL